MLSGFEQHNHEAFLAQLVGKSTAARAGTDYDDYRIIAECMLSHSLPLYQLRTCRLRRVGQPIEIVEAMMDVTTHGIGRSLIFHRFEDGRIAVKRLQFDASNLLKEWSSLDRFEGINLLLVIQIDELRTLRAVQLRDPICQ